MPDPDDRRPAGCPACAAPRPRSTTWWGRACVRAFEEAAYAEADLLAGRALARSGRLGAIMVLPSMASAVVDPRHRPRGDGAGQGRLARRARPGPPSSTWRPASPATSPPSGRRPPGRAGRARRRGRRRAAPRPAEIETACECDAWVQPCAHALALLYQLAWLLDADPYVLTLLRGHPREWILDEIESRLVAERGPAERDDAMQRAALLLSLAEHAPAGHGLADSSVAAYDEAVAQLLDPED